MLLGLLIVLSVVAGATGLVVFSPAVGRKWDELQGKRWERKLIEGTLRAEEEEKKPTPEEIAEAEKELEKEMAEW